MNDKVKEARKKWVNNASENELRAYIFETRGQYERTKDKDIAEIGQYAFKTYEEKFGLEKLYEKQPGFPVEIFYNNIGMGDITNREDIEIVTVIGKNVVRQFIDFWQDLDKLGGIGVHISTAKDGVDLSKIKKNGGKINIEIQNKKGIMILDWLDLPNDLIRKLENHLRLQKPNFTN